MAPNAGAIFLVILSSLTPIHPSKASPESLFHKARASLFLSSCCHAEDVQKAHRHCRCVGLVNRTSGAKGNFVSDSSSSADHGMVRASKTRSKNHRSVEFSRTLPDNKIKSVYAKLNELLGRNFTFSATSRNTTLHSILRRVSNQLHSRRRAGSTVGTLEKKTEDFLSQFSFNSLSSSKSSEPTLVGKRQWEQHSHTKSVLVYSKDERTQIVPPLLRKFPYSNIVRLSTGCTGTLITPFHVLTAAHCVHNGREFRNKLEMMKIEIPDAIGIRVYYVEKIGIPHRWLNPSSPNYQQASFDYAVVRLSYGVHGRYQFLPLSVPTEATLHHSLQFLGFPNFGLGLWRSVCPASSTKTFMGGSLILAQCDSVFGNSGAAIFTADQRSEKKVVGILSSTVSVGGNPLQRRYNIITALTETKLLDICSDIGEVGVFYGVCPSPETIPKRRRFQRKIKTIPFFG